MKTIIYLVVFSLLLISTTTINAQCNVTANANTTTITCGQSVVLSHNGSTSGNISFSEDFNTQSATGWAFTQQATFTNPCSPNGVDNTPHIWMGAQSGVPRILETNPLNFGPAVAPAGGTICFDLLFASQGNSSPCEGPDESDEGVYIQYSIDNGATWVTIHYFNPNGGNDPQLVNWNNWCFAIPAAALANNVKFRWFQDADSGAAYDHWGIDNVQIIVNDPNVLYTWSHDGYTSSLPGTNPTAVTPTTTTTYTVTMTTSSGTCTDQVTIVVNNPDVQINAGADLLTCPGICVDLAATATVVNDPGGIKTFSNIQTETFDASLFGGGTVNVNVQGLNMDNVNPGSLTQVCLSNVTFSAALGGGGVDLLTLKLICPDGTELTLVPAGDAPTGSPGVFGFGGTPSSYQNVCFVTTSPNLITDIVDNTPQAMPITGTYQSNQPLSGMDGCTANGTWSINVSTSNLFGGSGTFDGWSLTFDDEIDEYTPDFVWTPTTYMNAGQENTLNPTVCVLENMQYIITASDSAGCVTVSDTVLVSIDPQCCDLEIDNVNQVDPTCTQSGSITINVSGQTTGLLYSIDNGVTTQTTNTFPNLSAGTYTIKVMDDQDCPVYQTIVLSNNNAPVIDSITTVDATCSNADGAITIYATGGSGTLTYSTDGGTTFQASPNFANLAGNTYAIQVSDAAGCTTNSTVTIQNGSVPQFTTTTTNPTCGQTDGTITVNATNGTPPYTYSINGGTLQSTNSFQNLAPGSYSIMVQDNLGCETTQLVILNTDQQPTITINGNPIVCLGQNVTLTANGALTYVWTPTVTNGTSFTPTSTTTYTVVGTDVNGCTGSSTFTVTVLPIPTAGINATPISGDSPLQVTFSNTSTNATNYSWEFGNGTPSVTTASNGTQNTTYQTPGDYTVILTASNGYCEDTASVLISVEGFPPFEMHIPNVFTPNGDQSNDTFFIGVNYATSYFVEIFNRWGNKMFELGKLGESWDGKNATEGVYFFKYHIVDTTGKDHIGHGHVTLIRE